ncbi:hypothetical protein K2B98_001515 [Vibrio parahaemolyticus]|nr:hypothetical protein [Vibrio parahaemolyticus]EGQ9495065.1 hypothetical protein [Vibrio parahaemolyticus]EGQ9506498.1 hypothetical protein [Vibrio parahaemolyticus]EGQ9812000.1 hypothetical protein [Vibrio parahaemolyticus]EGR0044319.1 hypothetical protein [Vibrio parahaemolyticus]
MITRECKSFQLFSDILVDARKTVSPNFTHYDLGELELSKLEGRYVRDLPKVPFSLCIELSSLSNFCFKEFDTACINFCNNEHYLTVNLEIKVSHWKEKFSLDFFTEVIKGELIKNGIRLRNDERLEITEGFLDHHFTFHLQADSNLHGEILRCLKAYKMSYVNALVRVNSLDVKIVEKKYRLNNGGSMFHPIAEYLLNSPKLLVKLVGVAVVTIIFGSTVIGVIADYLEVFG